MEHPWIKYTGDYEKEFYDIKLEDGTIYKECWPNAGYFFAKGGNQINDYQVQELKLSHINWW